MFFYWGEVWDVFEYCGLGFYVCKVFCDKYDGSLLIENGFYGGGSVMVSIGIEWVDK